MQARETSSGSSAAASGCCSSLSSGPATVRRRARIMRCQTQAGELAAALAVTTVAIDQKPAFAALGAVRMAAAGDRVRLTDERAGPGRHNQLRRGGRGGWGGRGECPRARRPGRRLRRRREGKHADRGRASDDGRTIGDCLRPASISVAADPDRGHAGDADDRAGARQGRARARETTPSSVCPAVRRRGRPGQILSRRRPTQERRRRARGRRHR